MFKTVSGIHTFHERLVYNRATEKELVTKVVHLITKLYPVVTAHEHLVLDLMGMRSREHTE